jgi:hypothetical protein
MVVYHVSNNGDGKSGILSSSTMQDHYPEAYEFMNAVDVEYMQYEDDEANVIVSREPANKFNEEAIQ